MVSARRALRSPVSSPLTLNTTNYVSTSPTTRFVIKFASTTVLVPKTKIIKKFLNNNNNQYYREIIQ